MTAVEKMVKKVKALSTEMLCSVFEETNNNHGKHIPTVRGYLLDELERRDPVAFAEWMDCDDPTRLDKPSEFFTNL